jgi:hypothetical protein
MMPRIKVGTVLNSLRFLGWTEAKPKANETDVG